MTTSRPGGLLFVIGVLFAPFAYAAPDEAAVRGLDKQYVEAFNTGNARRLIEDVFAVSDLDKKDRAMAWDTRFEALRREDFGRLDLYDVRICSQEKDSAVVEMRYSFQYTFGGVMPPGDQALRLFVTQSPAGLRVTEEAVIPFDEAMACQQ